MPIRVIVIDDSAMVRRVLRETLETDPEIEVVGTAPDPFVGRDMILEHHPDVVLLDLEMPRMDGLEFLTRLMHHMPMPVVVVSSLTTAGGELALEALRRGAVDVIAKPNAAYSLRDMAGDLLPRVKAAARATPKVIQYRDPDKSGVAGLRLTASRKTVSLIAIGASTGGPSALDAVLAGLPFGSPPIVIVQHMPAAMMSAFASRLDRSHHLDVRLAEDRQVLAPGMVLVAPADHHLEIRRSGALFKTVVDPEPAGTLHRPSVDVLFESVAHAAGSSAVGVILTGMGEDGASGLHSMHDAGARTIAQDEASCVVFGMPKVAIDRGGVDHVVPLADIGPAIASIVAVPASATPAST